MSDVKLFIASSIDGFIARDNGSVDWLNDFDDPAGHDYDYGLFYSGISTLLMGRKTYEEVLGFGVDWPYADRRCLVASSNRDLTIRTPDTRVVTDLSNRGVEEIKSDSSGDIWLVGGGMLVRQLLEGNLVDEMIICTIPLLLGTGIPLFVGGDYEARFDVVTSTAYETGAVQTTYRLRRDE